MARPKKKLGGITYIEIVIADCCGRMSQKIRFIGNRVEQYCYFPSGELDHFARGTLEEFEAVLLAEQARRRPTAQKERDHG